MYRMINQKVKVNIEDIASHAMLPYALYDSDGKLLAKKDDMLNAKLLHLLSLNELYRLASLEEIIESGKMISVISKEASEKLIDITKIFMDVAEKGNKPPLKTILSTRDLIYTETLANINKIKYIGELKIYYSEYYLAHAINVSILSTALGINLGVDHKVLKDLALGALLHDIGMTRIPKKITDKPAALTPDEYNTIKLHPRLGYKILKEDYFIDEKIAIVALQHHERYNGSGYPQGIEGDNIDYFAQIVSLADVYDASSSHKVYAPAKDPQSIVKELLKLSKSFNPKILQTLVHMIDSKI